MGVGIGKIKTKVQRRGRTKGTKGEMGERRKTKNIARATTRTAGIPSESDRTGEPLPPVPTRACNCPSTTKVVEDVMKVLDPTIKRTVSAELQTFGITMKEGFQSQSRMIAETAIGSVQDQVRAITRRSAEARSLGPAPAPSSSL